MSQQETGGIQCLECGFMNQPDRPGLSTMKCASCDITFKIPKDDDIDTTKLPGPSSCVVRDATNEEEEDYFNK